MKIMKALIIEDEDIIARVLQDKIKNVATDVTILDVLPSLKTARKWFLHNAEPDLIFMDIQLSDGLSFDLFNQYTLTCPIVFTTAYDEYAIRAFKVNGVDYLLKPINEEELKAAIDKCRAIVDNKKPFPTDIHQLVQSLTNPQKTQPQYKEKFIVNVRNQWMPINVRDIACFTKEAINYLYLFNGEKFMLDFTSLDEVEELLDSKKFYRANRQYIINIEAIKSVKPTEDGKVIVRLKEPLHKMDIDMSRLKAPSFKKWVDR
jgi:DNA-binding LytR/AlgR family response regulator